MKKIELTNDELRLIDTSLSMMSTKLGRWKDQGKISTPRTNVVLSKITSLRERVQREVSA